MDIRKKVLQAAGEYAYSAYSESDVQTALRKDSLALNDFGALLSPAAEKLLEPMAKRAKQEREKRFGNAVSLYTPLYIANYCANSCTYCGFSAANTIQRGKLSLAEIDRELQAISNTGLNEILLLTGEDRIQSDTAYIGEAVQLAARYFSTVGLEIYPLETNEYAYMQQCGADFVSVYQETYDTALYEKAHPGGPKNNFQYRFDSQERAVQAGMRGISFGALLGLGDFRRDSFAAGLHAYYIQQRYPHAEIAFSVPRLRAINETHAYSHEVGEKQLLHIMLAYRIFMPFASIAISTRERPGFRDNALGLAATKMSAQVKVSVGGHSMEKKGDGQFVISDSRSVADIHAAIREKGLQPVYSDFIRVYSREDIRTIEPKVRGSQTPRFKERLSQDV